MGLPNVVVNFKTTGITAIQRSEKGVVALILRDSTKQGDYTLLDVSDIPEGLSADNISCIKRTFTGYQTPPKTVLLHVVTAEADISESLDWAETQEFDYLVGPLTITPEESESIASWIKSQRENEDRKFKAVLPNEEADNDGVVNFVGDEIKTADGTYNTAQFCSRIAGLIAGTPMTISCTYAPLPEVQDVKRLTKAEADAAIDAGKFILINDGEKVKVGRAVNSFKTTTQDKGDAFKKIKIVEAMDMIRFDIKTTAEDSYIGKYANSYDNKCLLISAIKGYFEQLELDGILEAGTSEVGIDLDAQRTYLKSKGVDVNSMTDQQIKEAGTDSQVFLYAKVQILDAIEDITINISI